MTDQEKVLWGNNFLPLVQEIMKDCSIGIEKVVIHYEYGRFPVITLSGEGREDQVYLSTNYGTESISKFLNLPTGVQAITITSGIRQATIVEVRFIPVNIDEDAFLEAFGNAEFLWQPPTKEFLLGKRPSEAIEVPTG